MVGVFCIHQPQRTVGLEKQVHCPVPVGVTGGDTTPTSSPLTRDSLAKLEIRDSQEAVNDSLPPSLGEELSPS